MNSSTTAPTMETSKNPSPSRINGGGDRIGGRRPEAGLIMVEPPRREDLQPSYAQVLHGDDVAAHSWYGSMSTLQTAPRSTYLAWHKD